MTEYALPDSFAPALLAQHLDLREGPASEIERSYYDTFDGLLYEKGLVVVHEAGSLSLIERGSGEVRARAELPEPRQPLFASELEGTRLSDALQPLVDVRALLPLLKIHIREYPLDVLDDERKTVVRMRVQQPDGLAPRLRVAAVRGYDGELRRVRRALERELGLKPAELPLLEEAGATPRGPSSKVSVPLAFGQRSDRAAVAVLRALLDVIEANLEGAIEDVDSEFLHDLRVSVRRSRSVQRQLKGVFPHEELEHFRTEFRWLQQVTGDARDLDVYLLEFDGFRAMVPPELRDDLDPLLGVLRSRRARAREAMVAALRSHRASRLRSQWSRFLARLEDLPERDRLDASRPIGEVAGGRIRKVYRQMVRMGEAITAESPPEHYHELRKKGKELRYLLELFGSQVYPGEVVSPMVKALKALQDVLGRHQDREVQMDTLRSLTPELDAPSLMATGALVARLGEDAVAARGEFAARFGIFAGKAQRKLVKDTFG